MARHNDQPATSRQRDFPVLHMLHPNRFRGKNNTQRGLELVDWLYLHNQHRFPHFLQHDSHFIRTYLLLEAFNEKVLL